MYNQQLLITKNQTNMKLFFSMFCKKYLNFFFDEHENREH